jgi:hypothetical protein
LKKCNDALDTGLRRDGGVAGGARSQGKIVKEEGEKLGCWSVLSTPHWQSINTPTLNKQAAVTGGAVQRSIAVNINEVLCWGIQQIY